MKRDIAEAWVAALRSEEYTQTQGTLCAPNAAGTQMDHCCLGVLTDLGIQAGHLSGSEIMASYLSEATMEWAGIISGHNPAILIPKDWDNNNIAQDIPKVHPRVRSLGAVNDSGRHFKEIADLIEEQWEDL